jgi:uncharacterized protein (DUF3084 family)
MAGDIAKVISDLDAARAEALLVQDDITKLKADLQKALDDLAAEKLANQPLRDRVAALEAYIRAAKVRHLQKMADDANTVDGKVEVDEINALGL